MAFHFISECTHNAHMHKMTKQRKHLEQTAVPFGIKTSILLYHISIADAIHYDTTTTTKNVPSRIFFIVKTRSQIHTDKTNFDRSNKKVSLWMFYFWFCYREQFVYMLLMRLPSLCVEMFLSTKNGTNVKQLQQVDCVRTNARLILCSSLHFYY